MTLASATPASPPIAPAESAEPTVPQQWPYRMTLEVYEQISRLGVIRPEEHVVLLDGLLVQTMTQGSPHFNAVDRGRDALIAAAPLGWYVRADGPIWLRTGPAGVSAPEPDLAVVVGTRDRYEDRPPEVGEVGLLVEIASDADAFRVDRKGLTRYAHAGVPTVWIATLFDRRVHVYTEPSGPGEAPAYGRVEVKQAGDLIEATLPPSGPNQPPTVLGPVAVGSFFRPVP